MSVLFRVDAGNDLGLGHLSRCLALAAALTELGLQSTFLVPDEGDVLDRVRTRGFEALEFPRGSLRTPHDLLATVETAARLGSQVIVVDSYHIDESYLLAVRATGAAVAVIDDLARHAFPCQLVVNGGAAAASLPYRTSARDVRFLLGPQYAMLRPEFWNRAARPEHDAVANILLTVGGSDPHNLLTPLLELLVGLTGTFSVTAVVGPFSRQTAGVEQAARESGRQINIVRAPASMRDLMRQADLAVSAAGQTLYELVRLAVPTVAIEIADNQQGALQALTAAGAVRSAGRVGDSGLAVRIANAVTDLVADAPARAALGQAAATLLDGQGARRVATAIAEL